MPEALVGLAVAAMRGWLPDLRPDLGPPPSRNPAPSPGDGAESLSPVREASGGAEAVACGAIEAVLSGGVVVPAHIVDLISLPTGLASAFIEGR
jgi:hypothetical protein